MHKYINMSFLLRYLYKNIYVTFYSDNSRKKVRMVVPEGDTSYTESIIHDDRKSCQAWYLLSKGLHSSTGNIHTNAVSEAWPHIGEVPGRSVSLGGRSQKGAGHLVATARAESGPARAVSFC